MSPTPLVQPTEAQTWSSARANTYFQWAKAIVGIALAIWAAQLCWTAVSWALQPGLFPFLDELSNPAIFLDGSYHQIVHFFPVTFYNDRPVGWAFVRLLTDWFGFNYSRQVACFLAIHFLNCGLAFLLFRRLGVSIPISVAGIGLFGSLATTAQTATYVGAPFDVLGLFFLLACTLAILSERRGSSLLSAVLFLAALRSKEFGIVIPFLLTVLVALRLPPMSFRKTLASLTQRLWMHYLVLIVFGLRYLFLYREYRATFATNNPYRMDFHLAAALKSLSYYTSLVFDAQENWEPLPPLVLVVAFAAILGWAIYRRRAGLAFAACAYVLTLLPVCLIANRTAFYVYAPQVFLILVICLLVEDALALLGKREVLRWAVGVGIAIACFCWCLLLQDSPHFANQLNWNLTVRRISMRTASDVNAQLPRMGANTHVYVNHNRGVTPWLFLVPCSYLRLINKQRTIDCIADQPNGQLRALYAADHGPKYFLDYHNDGSITVTPPRE